MWSWKVQEINNSYIGKCKLVCLSKQRQHKLYHKLCQIFKTYYNKINVYQLNFIKLPNPNIQTSPFPALLIKMEQNGQTDHRHEDQSLTQKGEPGEEGCRAEVEQRQKQHNKVERDSLGFIPPVVKQRCVCTVITDIMQANAAVLMWIHIWVWTNHWDRWWN